MIWFGWSLTALGPWYAQGAFMLLLVGILETNKDMRETILAMTKTTTLFAHKQAQPIPVCELLLKTYILVPHCIELLQLFGPVSSLILRNVYKTTSRIITNIDQHL